MSWLSNAPSFIVAVTLVGFLCFGLQCRTFEMTEHTQMNFASSHPSISHFSYPLYLIFQLCSLNYHVQFICSYKFSSTSFPTSSLKQVQLFSFSFICYVLQQVQIFSFISFDFLLVDFGFSLSGILAVFCVLRFFYFVVCFIIKYHIIMFTLAIL